MARIVVVRHHPVNGLLVHILELRAQLLILLAITPWIQREHPRVTFVRQLVQDDAHGPNINRMVILLQLKLGREIADCTYGTRLGFPRGVVPEMCGCPDVQEDRTERCTDEANVSWHLVAMHPAAVVHNLKSYKCISERTCRLYRYTLLSSIEPYISDCFFTRLLRGASYLPFSKDSTHYGKSPWRHRLHDDRYNIKGHLGRALF